MSTVQRPRFGLRLGGDPRVADPAGDAEFDSERDEHTDSIARLRMLINRVETRLPGLRPGLVSAISSLTAMVLFVVLVWGTSATGTADFGAAVGVGTAAWLLGHGVPLSAGGVTIGLTPLGLWLAAVWLTVRSVERGRERADSEWTRYSVDVVGGYGIVIVLAALSTLLGPARPSVLGLILALSVPAAALVVELCRALNAGDDRLPERLHGIPAWAVRGLAPAARGLGALSVLALLVILGALLVRWDVVTGLYAAVGTGVVGGLLLTLGQLCYLPTLGMWALAVLAGSGFQITAGGHVGLDSSQPGLLPMLPALGLLPSEGVYPSWTKAAMLAPVIVGALVGRWVDQEWPRLAGWRAKALSVGVAVGLLGIAMWVLGALATGSVGDHGLREVGIAHAAVAMLLTTELGLGAAVWSIASVVRARLARGTP